MPKRRGPVEPPPIEIKQFESPEEIDRAIAKLRRRLEEVRALDPKVVRYDDQRIDNVAANISDTILEIFGPNSPEYRRHQHHQIWEGTMYMNMSEDYMQECFAAGIPQTAKVLEGLIDRLQEKRGEFQVDSVGRARATFECLELHPRIAEVSADLYKNGHYRNAVLDASLALENYVKEKSRCRGRDGADLMRYVFSKNNPVIGFNTLTDDTDLSEQEGLMHLFEGVMLALRNPRAHTLSDDSPEEALEYIALLSLLAKRLEKAQRLQRVEKERIQRNTRKRCHLSQIPPLAAVQTQTETMEPAPMGESAA